MLQENTVFNTEQRQDKINTKAVQPTDSALSINYSVWAQKDTLQERKKQKNNNILFIDFIANCAFF